MSDNIRVEWSCLPGDPERFFNLPEQYDRSTLKRAYNSLIKIYRPETHPAEFQKIRSAYEVLEGHLRYGQEQNRRIKISEAWNSPFQSLHAHAAAGSSNVDAGSATSEPAINAFELAIESPEKAFQYLKTKTQRTPQDYFVLATLSDIVSPGDPNIYLKWLLTGLKSHPHDFGLQRLIVEFIVGYANPDVAASSLLTLSKVVGAEQFFPMTEQIWDRLICNLPFERVASTLNACEKNLSGRALNAKITFYVHILRSAIWKAPRDWVDEKFNFLDSHGSEIGYGGDSDLDILQILRDYFNQDREARLHDATRAAIDKAIESYCTEPWKSYAPKITTICDELARNALTLLEAFAPDSNESDRRTLYLLAYITSNLIDETGLEFPPSQVDLIERQADSLIADLRASIIDTGNKIRVRELIGNAVPLLALICGPWFLMVGFSWFGYFAVAWIGIALLLYFGVLRPFYIKKRINKKVRLLVENDYRTTWRPRIVRFIQACHAPLSISLDQLCRSARDLGQKEFADIVLSYVSQDKTLYVYNRLQLFSR